MTVLGCRIPTTGDLPLRHGLTAMAQTAERAGVASLWVGDHVVLARDPASRYPYAPSGSPPGLDAEMPFYEPLVALSWMAAATTRVRIGTAVLILAQRHPLVVAKQAATLDALSGGRLVLGVGAGWLAEEMEALGYDYASRGPRLEEAIEVLRRAWTGDPEFHGECFDVPAGLVCHPRPGRAGGVPVLVGGMTRAARERAARAGDGWLALLGLREDPEPLRGAAGGHDVLRVTGAVTDEDGLERLAALGATGFGELIVDVAWDDLDATGAFLERAVATVAASG